MRRRVMLDEGETTVQLGPPSDRTLYRDACGAASDGEDVGLLMGGVRRMGVDAPVRGAAVIAEWTVSTLALGTKDGLEARPATASARAEATGRYRLRGLPTDVAVVVRAAADSAVSGAARVDLRGRFFAVQQLDIAAPRRPAHVRGRSACASVPPGRPIGPRGDRMPMVYAVRTATEARRRAAGRPPTASRPARGRRSRRMFFGYSTEPH